MLRPVVQLENTGCGIASAANIAGVSYARARRVAHRIGIKAEDPALWSDTRYVRKLLRKFGFRTGKTEVPFTGWENLPDCALLSIKWHRQNGIPFWHWVVYRRKNGQEYVLDSNRSLKNNRRTDFGRMKPKWYISVTA